MAMQNTNFDDYLATQPGNEWDVRMAGYNDFGGAGLNPYTGMPRDQLIQQALGGLTRQQWFDKNFGGNGNGRAYDPATNTLSLMNNTKDDGLGVMAALMAGMGGLVASGAGIGASGANGFGADAAWGVNQGGGMAFDPYGDFGADYFSGANNYAGSAGFDPYADFSQDYFQTPEGQNGLRELSQLGDPTNLQDKMVKADQLLKAGSTAKQVADALGISESMVKTLGQLAATGLGIYGANSQANKIGTLSQQYAGYGAPYRDRLAASYADPAGFLANSPDIKASVDQGTSALARALSTKGNPTGSGSALQEMQNYATQGLYGQLGNERNRLANFGGLSNFNAAAPGLAGQEINAQGGALNALGSGISTITNQPTTLEQALNAMNSNNFKPNTGTGLA